MGALNLNKPIFPCAYSPELFYELSYEVRRGIAAAYEEARYYYGGLPLQNSDSEITG